jgi:MFS family permease
VVLAPMHRNRDFSLLWSGMAVSVLGTQISATAYPLLVLALHYSAADAGLVGFMATLPYAVLQLPAGAFIDRWNRKPTMIVCDIGRAVALASVVAGWLCIGSRSPS